jgi:lambda family phage portal protein
MRPVRAQQTTGIPYEGATTGRRARGWRSPTIGPNAGVLGSLSLLRDRSRQAVRNDGYGRSAIDRLVSNIIGTGIKPLSQAVDAEFRARVHALWLRWTDESDADGRLDWYGQQALAVRGWLEGGENFARLRPRLPGDGMSVPLQIQLLEPELVPLTYNDTRNGNRVRAGIEFSPIGSRVAYWMYRSRPGDPMDMDVQTLVRVPAETVVHLYDPVRPGQIRGLPHLTQALVRLFELDKFDDATLLRQQLSNLFVGFVSQPAGASEGGFDPLTGQPIEIEEGRGLVGLEPGLFQELAPGQEVNFSDPPSVGDTYEGFMRQQMLGVAAAVDVPYEVLTGDLSKVNDRTVRIILNEFRRRVTQRQHHIVVFQLCRVVWTAWFDRAVLSGALDVPSGYFDNPEPFRRVKWIPQGWAYIHPVQDVQAARESVRSGFRSRTEVVSELGEDVEVVDAEIAEDNLRADELGLRLESDPRHTDGSGKRIPVDAPED